ncbi:hypothetical protein HKD37_04G011224 [Glycine soja]
MMSNYHPNAHCVLNEKVVYEEDVIGGSRHHHMHHHHPETRERVKVVEYEQVPERRVVYEEKVAYDNDCYYSPKSGDYRTHVSEVERESSTTEFPNAYVSLNKKVVYEESENEGSHHHHLFHRHHHPETRESVKVVEYEQVPQRRVGEVVYEENSRTVWP